MAIRISSHPRGNQTRSLLRLPCERLWSPSPRVSGHSCLCLSHLFGAVCSVGSCLTFWLATVALAGCSWPALVPFPFPGLHQMVSLHQDGQLWLMPFEPASAPRLLTARDHQRPFLWGGGRGPPWPKASIRRMLLKPETFTQTSSKKQNDFRACLG